jgi:hypothetical protein
VFAGGGKGGFDVLGGVAKVFRDDGAVIHLVERLAEAQRDAKSSARLASVPGGP